MLEIGNKKLIWGLNTSFKMHTWKKIPFGTYTLQAVVSLHSIL